MLLEVPSPTLRGGQTVYFERFPGHWGVGEYLYTEGDRSLILAKTGERTEELRWFLANELRVKIKKEIHYGNSEI